MIKLFVKLLLYTIIVTAMVSPLVLVNDAGNSFSASHVLSGAGFCLEVVNLWDEGQTGSGREGVQMVLALRNHCSTVFRIYSLSGDFSISNLCPIFSAVGSTQPLDVSYRRGKRLPRENNQLETTGS
ncbi:uncharacterized protein B0T23DRAFT_391098 [Neurospora hispaniola]|uniref:Uncharacterized protein n=1 Tax=Neurospora hispaniola TaxID=588809 RepID=A0AAJ0MLK9_9PEZI|nr:hypothetical protein B0T23DRAFT_391098 [Neurospora hispaniola]